MDETKNCPFCGETIHAEAIRCKHCKSDLHRPGGAVPPAPPARPELPLRRGEGPPPKKSNSTTIIVVVVVCVVVLPCVIALGAALLIPALVRAKSKEKAARCANNLAQLWKLQNNYMVQYGGAQKMMPVETGGAFWLKLSDPEIRIIDPVLHEIYGCPLKGKHRPGRGTDYRGPASNVNKYGDGDPVGADKIGNHGDGGNVLRKSGDVQTVTAVDPLWRRAEERTTE